MNQMKYATLAFISLLMINTTSAEQKSGSVGAGVGSTYGWVGGSLDINLSDRAALTLGFGTTGGDSGHNLGIRYYLRDDNVTWRPRVTLQKGTNGVLVKEDCYYITCDKDYESFVGTSIGFGQSITFGQSKRHGIDVDLFYKITDGGMQKRAEELEQQGYELENDANKFDISIGYRYHF